jgi:hypothetical protein
VIDFVNIDWAAGEVSISREDEGPRGLVKAKGLRGVGAVRVVKMEFQATGDPSDVEDHCRVIDG